MAFDFLVPVAENVLAHNQLLHKQTIGKNISIHSKNSGLPSLKGVSIAFFGVNETRFPTLKNRAVLDISEIRLSLYQLMLGNWNVTMVDLGDINAGETIADTNFAVQSIVSTLVNEDVIPVVIGALQDVTYATYRAFDAIKPMVNVVSVDSRFDFGDQEELISEQSYMSKIIADQPTNLFNFSNIGYQSYFNAPEELDLMERLLFDAYRLGEITSDVALAEPILRNADIVSVDARAIRASEVGQLDNFSPNGFTGREICAISRYAGLSDKVAVFGLFECENSVQSHQLMAQILWYFIEGVNFRVKEFPNDSDTNFIKFIVPSDETDDLVFYKSSLTNRWWVEVPSVMISHNKSNTHALLPCTEKDYLESCDQKIPERWFKAYKKGFN